EVDADVQAPLPRVAEEAKGGAVAVDDLLEAAGVRPALLRRDARILDELVRFDVAAARRPVEQTGCGLPQRPRGGLVARVQEDPRRRRARERRCAGGEIVREGGNLLPAVARELTEEHPESVGRRKRSGGAVVDDLP